MRTSNSSDDEPQEHDNVGSLSYSAVDIQSSGSVSNSHKKRTRLLHQWLKFSDRVVLITNEIPKDMAPSQAKNVQTYAMQILRINPWPIPPNLLKIIQKANARALSYSVSMSFYHILSKRFFGSTWIGRNYLNSSVEEDGSLETNELVYFQSKIMDPNCFAVIELVATKHDLQQQKITGQYACGWALMKPFVCDTSTMNLNKQKSEGESILSLNVIGGTPRKLLTMKRDSIDEIGDKRVATINISFSKIQLEPNLVQENEIIGADCPVAGLQTCCFTYPDDRGKINDACIGGELMKNGASWLLNPCVSPALASTYRLMVNNSKVSIHRRLEYEESLLHYVNEIYLDAASTKKKNIFGRAKLVKQCVPLNGSGSIKGEIISRALKFGIHNGHALRGNKWYGVELSETYHDLDSLQSNRSIHIDGFVKHRLCALVSILQYSVKIARTTTKSHAEQAGKGTLISSDIINVVAGCQVYLPYDGKLLRLKNTKSKQNKVVCTLLHGSSCRIFTSNHIFSPDKILQSAERKTNTVEFELRCYDGSSRELCNETSSDDDDKDFSDTSDNASNYSPNSIKHRHNTREEAVMASPEVMKREINDTDSEELESSMISGDTFFNFLRILETDDTDTEAAVLSNKDSGTHLIRGKCTENDLASNIAVSKPDPIIAIMCEDAPLLEDADKNSSNSVDEETLNARQVDKVEDCCPRDNGNKMNIGSMLAGKKKEDPPRHSVRNVEDETDCATRTMQQQCSADLAKKASEVETDAIKQEACKNIRSKGDVYDISIQFVSYAASKSNTSLPQSIFFTFKFYDQTYTETSHFILNNSGISDSEIFTKPRLLIAENSPQSNMVQFHYYLSSLQPNERNAFVRYLETKNMFADVWDADSRMHIGTFLLPMKLLIAENGTMTQISKTFDVVSTRNVEFDGGEMIIHARKLIPGPIVGYVSVCLKNEVKRVGKTCDWEPTNQTEMARTPCRVGTCLLIDTDDELENMMTSIMKDSRYGKNMKSSTSRNRKSIWYNSMRRHKLASLAAARREMNQCDPRVAFFKDLMRDYKGPFYDEYKSLEVVKWYRQSVKKDFIQRHLAQSITKEMSLHPHLGQLIFFEFELTNPLNKSERFLIENSNPELRVVVESQEWSHLRQFVTPAVEISWSFPVERCVIDLDSNNEAHLMVNAHETVSIPFVFRHDFPSSASKGCHERYNITVKFIGTTHGDAVTCLSIDVFPPDSPIVDRTFYINASAGEVVRRSIKYFDNGHMAMINNPEIKRSNASFVRCIDLTSSCSVVCEWKCSDKVNEFQHVDVTYHCGDEYHLKEEFFVLFYADRYQSVLKECMHFVVAVKIPLYGTSFIGQFIQNSIFICSEKRTQNVAFFSDINNDLALFDAPKPFQLSHDLQNQALLKFKFLQPGFHKVIIHLVDQKTKKLVCAWMLRATCQLPTVSKVIAMV
mmetsp:Transcript_34093/g.50049  ORF Transcript_34093/g.50049 Transcript_34093/m.50049 type:complete len:1438 (+) Transcript_34093:97-4410(+)